MNNTLEIIGRKKELFTEDVNKFSKKLEEIITKSKFLIIGAAGSIGQAVTKELFKRNPLTLHCIDISENNLVELVRDLRSSTGYIDGDFKTFAVDAGSIEFKALMEKEGPYDYFFNLSALKHVRSEKDPYTLMRMTEVNIINTIKSLNIAKEMKAKKYFCVSTDKAAYPINMMGASKYIMEMFLTHESLSQKISMARFANVAFSDGSLLHGFNQRIDKRQPFSIPQDIKRYFITSSEAGELCLLSCLLGLNREIFFSKPNRDLKLTSFVDIAQKYLIKKGYEPYKCSSENEARKKIEELININKWPCYFFKSDTTGEKKFEEFFTSNENIDMSKFKNIGIIKKNYEIENEVLERFLVSINNLKKKGIWTKNDLLKIYFELLPKFNHQEKNKYLDEKM